MILDRVTITGADDSIRPAELLPLSRRFPWVEWGILLSRSSEGRPRFPSLPWIEELICENLFVSRFSAGLTLSGHLCGSWVRDLCAGGSDFAEERPTIIRAFDRIQLNFHAIAHRVQPDAFARGLAHLSPRLGFILQFDNVNNDLLAVARAGGATAAPLFDTSGGAGVLPDRWPKAVEEYSGYAGGLSPQNLAVELEQIAAAAGDHRVWIDAETHVRTEKRFDLNKVERFLEIAVPWVWGLE